MGATRASVWREVNARNTSWARRAAAALAGAGIRPNTVSILSVLFAAAAGYCLYHVPDTSGVARSLLLVAAVLLVQGRLLCNLFDGMIAVEGGFRTLSGEIFNDFPDRLSDPVILVCAGYAVRDLPGAVALGWLAGLLAVLTAYARTLAGASGAPQRFLGPMAKQHRMALLCAALTIAAIVRPWSVAARIIALGLLLIVLGAGITTVRRARAAVRDLEAA
jgi:phosphatidylglycerophosphate synthase